MVVRQAAVLWLVGGVGADANRWEIKSLSLRSIFVSQRDTTRLLYRWRGLLIRLDYYLPLGRSDMP